MAEKKITDIEPRIIEDADELAKMCEAAHYYKTALVRAQDELNVELSRLTAELDRVESNLRGHVLAGGSLPESSKVHLKRIEGRDDIVVDGERLLNVIEYIKQDYPKIAEYVDACVRFRAVKPTTRLTYE